MQRRVAQVSEFNAELEEAGAWVFGTGLRPASSATVVRADGGDVSMTDGPYAETKEQMGGFWIIEAPDLDAALDWAAKAAAACEGPVEVRPDGRCLTRSRTIFRREAGRCTATLIRVLGDIDLAEDAVAEAFAIAAERWPIDGVPPNPGGWITTTARNRAIDRLRRESTRTDRHVAAHRLHVDDMEPDHNPELDDLDAFVDVVADDQLRLMFLCCHPALAADAQVALTLRLLGGLDTPEIARAFLVPEATLAQRIVRAKRKLRDNHAPYRVPARRRAPRPAARRARHRVPHLHRGAHRHHRATTSPASTSPARRSASDGCSPSSCPTNPKPSASSP